MRWHNHLKNQAPLHSHERQKIALAENDKHSGAKIKLRLHHWWKKTIPVSRNREDIAQYQHYASSLKLVGMD
jgi:hypothetical protein